jgi:hypothetical protein
MRFKRSCGFLLLLVAVQTAAVGDDLPPDVLLLARFKQKIRQDLTRIPNYTCLETMQRFERANQSQAFEKADTVRLEVSNVGGKELFSFPGARKFEDRSVASFVSEGTVGDGTFSVNINNLFGHDAISFQNRGEVDLDGERAIRYDFHVPQFISWFTIRIGANAVIVPFKGSFWFNPGTLDLLRLDMFGEDLPSQLDLRGAGSSIRYTRVQIADSTVLLPAHAELLLTKFSGEARRNLTEFSQCREYQTESSISFDLPPETSPALPPPPPIHEVQLPAGLMVTIALENAIDSHKASIGDQLRARVLNDVRYNGDQVLPKGAVLTGRIRTFQRPSPKSPFAVGIEFTEVEWRGSRAGFFGDLIDIDNRIAGMTQLVSSGEDGRGTVTLRQAQGVGLFYMKGSRFRIPPGLHMVWRTIETASTPR